MRDLYHEQLILLDPAPGAKDIDHAVESPTFESVLKGHIEEHLEDKSMYRRETK